MTKKTYEYKQANLLIEALDYMRVIHSEMMDLTGLSGRKLRKADVWLAALSSLNEQSSEKQLEILSSLGVDY